MNGTPLPAGELVGSVIRRPQLIRFSSRNLDSIRHDFLHKFDNPFELEQEKIVLVVASARFPEPILHKRGQRDTMAVQLSDGLREHVSHVATPLQDFLREIFRR